ncbi:TPA: helix-turn-helix transcriptional regulator [Bacillus cereus]|nr:helix-turn-helix transcriptional regulator [Bacillus cereus]
MDAHIIGKNIKRLRALKGVSRKEFSKDINTPYSTITSWENGEKIPRQQKIAVLTEYFNITEDFLLSHEINDDELLNKLTNEEDPVDRLARILYEKYMSIPDEHKPRIEKELIRYANLLQLEFKEKYSDKPLNSDENIDE